jgi:hypothetical protein
MKKKDLSVPTEQSNDVKHSFVKVLIDAFPGIGSIVAELFGYVLPQPIERRRLKWMTDVAESIYELQENSEINIESLKENQAFISIVMQTSQIAQRNHQEEKLIALRNAVLNTAKGIDIAARAQCEHTALTNVRRKPSMRARILEVYFFLSIDKAAIIRNAAPV